MGHTDRDAFVSDWALVHPHIRGAYAGKRRKCPHLFGSSPHTWGIQKSCSAWNQGMRFIPTYVGHTGTIWITSVMPSVHPHIRGAYGNLPAEWIELDGSSPHTWGIPAGPYHPRRCRPVHPHIRGAYVELLNRCREMYRFIPTYVGHTECGNENPAASTVHPHIRGAYLLTSVGLLSLPGSSPHTWGILRGFDFSRNDTRFIPTYVGHTTCGSQCALLGSVHPHIRGAYGWHEGRHGRQCGSSPHTWGILVGPGQRFHD